MRGVIDQFQSDNEESIRFSFSRFLALPLQIVVLNVELSAERRDGEEHRSVTSSTRYTFCFCPNPLLRILLRLMKTRTELSHLELTSKEKRHDYRDSIYRKVGGESWIMTTRKREVPIGLPPG
jgi:hypothetical protein